MSARRTPQQFGPPSRARFCARVGGVLPLRSSGWLSLGVVNSLGTTVFVPRTFAPPRSAPRTHPGRQAFPISRKPRPQRPRQDRSCTSGNYARCPLMGPTELSAPTKREILDGLEALEVALSSMMRRWQCGIPPEIRAEIMIEAYEPVLHILLRAERRGHKRPGWREPKPAN
jgi:hypothetical protein